MVSEIRPLYTYTSHLRLPLRARGHKEAAKRAR